MRSTNSKAQPKSTFCLVREAISLRYATIEQLALHVDLLIRCAEAISS